MGDTWLELERIILASTLKSSGKAERRSRRAKTRIFVDYHPTPQHLTGLKKRHGIFHQARKRATRNCLLSSTKLKQQRRSFKKNSSDAHLRCAKASRSQDWNEDLVVGSFVWRNPAKPWLTKKRYLLKTCRVAPCKTWQQQRVQKP